MYVFRAPIFVHKAVQEATRVQKSIKLHSRHPLFLRPKNMLSNIFEEIGTHVSCTTPFFRSSVRFRDNAKEVILVLCYALEDSLIGIDIIKITLTISNNKIKIKRQ
jgi:hypothetical protein